MADDTSWMDNYAVDNQPQQVSSDNDWMDKYAVEQPQQQQEPQRRDDWMDKYAIEARPRDEERPEPKPEDEGVLGTAAREAAHGVLPAAAAVPGWMAGAAAGAALGSAIPGAGTLVGGALGLAGGLIGGGLAAYGASTAQEAGLRAIGMDDSQQRALNASLNPTAATVGQLAPLGLAMGPGAVGKTAAERLFSRGAGAVLGGGLEAAQEYATEGKVDPLRAGGAALAGGVFAKPYDWTERAAARVGLAPPRLANEQVEKENPAAVRTQGTASEATPADTGHPPVTGERERVDPQGAAKGPENYAKTPGVSTSEEAVARRAPEAEGQRVYTPDEVEVVARREPAAAAPTEPTVSPEVGLALKTKLGEPAGETQTEAAGGGRRPAAADLSTPEGRAAVVEEPAPTTPREAIEQRAPGETVGDALRGLGARRPPAGERLKITPAERELGEGREPTQPIPILERGLQRVEEGVPPGTPQPPEMQAMARQGPGGPGGTPGGGPAGGAPTGGPAGGVQLQPAHAKDMSDSLWDKIVRIFAPESRPSGRVGMDVFRRFAGLADRMQQRQQARFSDDVWKAANQMSDMDQRKWVNFIEGGQELNTPGHAIYDPNWAPPPELKQATTDLKQAFKEWENEIRTWPQAAQLKFQQEYLNHMWKNPPTIGEGLPGISQKGSLNKRYYQTDEAGRAAGLDPVTTNPLERLTNYATAMGRVMTEYKTQAELENIGKLGWFKPKIAAASGTPTPYTKDAPPPGYAPVRMWTNKEGATAYVPRDMAYVLNNQFAPHGGFSSEGVKDVADAVRRFKNWTTALELTTSLYHPFTTGFESVSSGVARAFQQLGTGPGSLERAATSFAKAWIEPIVNAIPLGPKSFRQQYGISDPLGQQWIEKYQGLRPVTPEEKRVLDALTEGGIRPVGTTHAIDFELSKNWSRGSIFQSMRRGSLQKEFNEALQAIRSDWKTIPPIAINTASRILQSVSDPIFKTYVPRLKMAAMAQDMQAYIHANPSATPEQLAAVANKFSTSADNRIGEMIGDHLGMNKVLKAAAFTAMRSFSFTIGGPGEVLGGAYAGIKGAMKGQNTLSMSSSAFNPKTGYAIAFPFTVVVLGSIWNYMRTGQWPQDWRDTVTPRTGGMVKSGGQVVPERVLLPGYHKDFLGYFYHPGDELKAKMAGPWAALTEQLTGKDYRGDPIAPPVSAAGLGQHLLGRGEQLGSHLLPIAAKSMADIPKEGSKLSTIERALGFRNPGAYIQNPERIEQVQDIVARKAWRTKERHINADREARGLPPLPPMKFANEPEKLPRTRKQRATGYQKGGEVQDYDYEGARKAGVQPDERGHLPDTYKLPNHITFSDDSIYHSDKTPGGHWTWTGVGDHGQDTWNFKPSDYNLQQHSPKQLDKYFQQYEPDSTVELPGRERPVGYRRGGMVPLPPMRPPQAPKIYDIEPDREVDFHPGLGDVWREWEPIPLGSYKGNVYDLRDQQRQMEQQEKATGEAGNFQELLGPDLRHNWGIPREEDI